MTEIEITRVAINRLVENASYNLAGHLYSDVEWTDSRKIFTEEDLNASIIQIKTELEEALNSRVYPSIEDQLDALWHSMNVGLLRKDNPFYEMIKEVKDTNPKPGA